jgi:hypothetical protein
MQVSATFEGEQVTIVDIDANGSTYYVTYITSAEDMKVSRRVYVDDTATIATSATY